MRVVLLLMNVRPDVDMFISFINNNHELQYHISAHISVFTSDISAKCFIKERTTRNSKFQSEF